MTTRAERENDIRQRQAELRKRAAEALAGMSRDERAARSALAQKHLLALPEYHSAHRLMLYAALADEVDTHMAIRAAIAAGKEVYTPKVARGTRRLLICRLRALGQLRLSDLQIPEPEAEETILPAQLDFVLAPGRVFDRHGNRIGRGGGYYDRFLAQPGLRAARFGFAFDRQFCDRIPTRLGDYPLRYIITESGVVGRAAAARGAFPGNAQDHARPEAK